jgi:glycosyltransferase 2 family protein
MSLKRRAFTVGKTVISVALIATILSRIDYSRFLTHWRDLTLFAVVISLALLAFQTTVIAGMRLKLVLESLGTRCALKRTSTIALCGFFIEQVAFGFVGGDVMRLWLLRCAEVPLKRAVAAVLIDRCLGFTGIVLLVLLGLPGLMRLVTDVDQRIIVMVLATLLFVPCAAIASFTLLPEKWRRLPLFDDVSEVMSAAIGNIAAVRRLSMAFALAAATHLINVLVIFIVGRALGIPISLEQWFFIVPAVLLFSMLPVSAGGWGVREGAMVMALQGFGIPAEVAVVPSILFGLGVLIVTLPGAIVWMASRKMGSIKDDPVEPGPNAMPLRGWNWADNPGAGVMDVALR